MTAKQIAALKKQLQVANARLLSIESEGQKLKDDIAALAAALLKRAAPGGRTKWPNSVSCGRDHKEAAVTNSLLMFAAAGVGFGGSPWVGFAIGASVLVLLGIPQQLALLKRYAGQPKTDIILTMMFEVGLAVAGAFVSAWAGYFLVLLLKS
jgi:hypothetical protein